MSVKALSTPFMLKANVFFGLEPGRLKSAVTIECRVVRSGCGNAGVCSTTGEGRADQAGHLTMILGKKLALGQSFADRCRKFMQWRLFAVVSEEIARI